jgi:hypothetical protein
MLGNADASNISSKFREGYEPVRAEDHPELQLSAVTTGQFKGCIENGGLVLCKFPAEFAKQRDEYYQTATSRAAEAVDNNLMRENDPRMPLLRPERKSRVSFGSGE